MKNLRRRRGDTDESRAQAFEALGPGALHVGWLHGENMYDILQDADWWWLQAIAAAERDHPTDLRNLLCGRNKRPVPARGQRALTAPLGEGALDLTIVARRALMDMIDRLIHRPQGAQRYPKWEPKAADLAQYERNERAKRKLAKTRVIRTP